jgi:sec-independent protein translocase protein TatA
MFRPGPLEIGLIVFIVLILFGAGKLPQVSAQLGKGIRSFRRAQSGEDESAVEEKEEEAAKPVATKTTRRKRATTKKG